MAAPKNHAKAGGRKKGVPNKVNADLRATVQNFIEGKMDAIDKDWKQMQPYQRMQTLTKLLEFVLPKGIAVDLSGSAEITLKQFLEMPSDKRLEVVKGLNDGKN